MVAGWDITIFGLTLRYPGGGSTGRLYRATGVAGPSLFGWGNRGHARPRPYTVGGEDWEDCDRPGFIVMLRAGEFKNEDRADKGKGE